MSNIKRYRNKSNIRNSKNRSNIRKSKNTPDIRIEVPIGDYDTDDAYNNVLGYVSKKACIGGCGFSCNPELSVIEQFRLSETCSQFYQPQKIWHFFITFSQKWDYNQLLKMAVSIADDFSPWHQVLFGLDEKGRNPHLHFAVNAYSYHPDYPVLSEETMKGYMKKIQNFLAFNYGGKVTLSFQRKE